MLLAFKSVAYAFGFFEAQAVFRSSFRKPAAGPLVAAAFGHLFQHLASVETSLL